MKIALVEIGGSHDECIYSQIKIIKSYKGIDLTLICDDSLKENSKYFDLVDKKIFIPIRKGYKQWIDYYRLWRLIKSEGFDKIILNTGQGMRISKLLYFPFGNHTKFYGILHNSKKIIASLSQKIISRKVKHYYVLNEYLESNIEKGEKNNLSFSVLHPVFFPKYPELPINKKKDEIWICIPGRVELKRRDYETLFKSIKDYGINKNIKFLLLGSCSHTHGDGDYVKKQISNLSVQNNFLTWENFIPVNVFHSMIKNSDYILPLIHEGDISGDYYKTIITGAYNIAVGYKKAMLIEKAISNDLLDYNPIIYDKNFLMKTINQLNKSGSINPYNHKKLSFDFQRRTYLNSLGLTLPDKN